MATAVMGNLEQKQIPWWLALIEGVLAILVGLALLVWPVKTFTTLVFFLGFWWLFDGMFDIVTIFMDSHNWGWKLFMGIVGILAGFFLIQTPLQGAIVLSGTYIIIMGFLGIVYGGMALVNAFRGGGLGAGILGVVSILLGIYILFHVWATSLALPWLFGLLAIAGGVLAIILAFRLKK